MSKNLFISAFEEELKNKSFVDVLNEAEDFIKQLTAIRDREIIKDFQSGTKDQVVIAKKFGLSQARVSQIIRNHVVGREYSLRPNPFKS